MECTEYRQGREELTRYEEESKHEDENSIPSLSPVTIFTTINEKRIFKVLVAHNLCRQSREKNPKAKKNGGIEEKRASGESCFCCWILKLELKLTCRFSIIQMTISSCDFAC